MSDVTHRTKNSNIDITNIENKNIIVIRVETFKDNYDKEPKIQEIMINTENNYVVSGVDAIQYLLHSYEKKEGN